MDYHIYIHSIQGEENETNPKSFNNSKTKPTEDSEEDDAMSFGAVMKMGSQLLNESAKSAAMGAIKAFAPLAGVLVAAKVTDHAISTIEPFISAESGDYRFGVAYQNVKGVVTSITNPLSTTMNRLHQLQSYDLANRRNEQQRLLIGDSIINNYGGLKI